MVVDEKTIQEISEYALEGKKVKSIKKLYDYTRQKGTGYHNYIYRVKTENETYEVTEKRNCLGGGYGLVPLRFETHYEVRPWAEVEAEKAERHATIKWRSEFAIVSEEIAAVTVPVIENDDDAIAILSDIHAAFNQLRKRPADDPIFWELTECGISRRCAAIAQLIGEEMVQALSLQTSQKRSKIVANYLTDGLVRR